MAQAWSGNKRGRYRLALAAGWPMKETKSMKTILIAALAGMMLSPAAFAAVPTAVSKPASFDTQSTKSGVVLLAGGPGRNGTIVIPRGKGFIPGKSLFG